MSEIWHKSVGGETISRFGYEYDVLRQIKNLTQQTGTTPAQTYSFDYDPVQQLKSATLADMAGGALKSSSYDYHRGGNRIGEANDNDVSKEVPNKLNQLMSRQGGTGLLPIRGRTDEPSSVTVNGRPAATKADNSFEGAVEVVAGSNPVTVVATDVNGNATTDRYEVVVTGTGTKTLVYDLNGNLTSDGEQTFEWDPLDRLIAVTSGAHRSEFTYNGAGQRATIVEKDNAIVTSIKNLLSVGTEICEERDASNNVMKRYYGQGMQVGSANYYYTRDHLGSVREVTDSGGAVRAPYNYTVWGQRTKLEGDLEADFGFTGHYSHQVSGLVLAPLRPYDPNAAKWLNRDPIGEKGGLNLYNYVHNNPINAWDPLGLLVEVYYEGIGSGGGGRTRAAILRAKHSYVHIQTPSINVTLEMEGPHPGRPYGNVTIRDFDSNRKRTLLRWQMFADRR